MIRSVPRIWLLLFVAIYAFACGHSNAAADASIVGAIRWDAWYGNGGATKAVEASLGMNRVTSCLGKHGFARNGTPDAMDQ